MPTGSTVSELFKAADLSLCGPVRWGTPVSECRCGVYVVALVRKPALGCRQRNVEYLPSLERKRWLQKQPIIYIGRTRRSLAVRIAEFYCHEYGDKRPHRGGQAVILLCCDRWVYWSPTNDPKAAERTMIDAFVDRAKELPFANRRRWTGLLESISKLTHYRRSHTICATPGRLKFGSGPPVTTSGKRVCGLQPRVDNRSLAS